MDKLYVIKIVGFSSDTDLDGIIEQVYNDAFKEAVIMIAAESGAIAGVNYAESYLEAYEFDKACIDAQNLALDLFIDGVNPEEIDILLHNIFPDLEVDEINLALKNANVDYEELTKDDALPESERIDSKFVNDSSNNDNGFNGPGYAAS